MAIYIANVDQRPMIKVKASTVSTDLQPTSTSIGCFIVQNSSGEASVWCSTGTLTISGADAAQLLGVLGYCNSSNSSDLLGVSPILPNDLLTIDVSTVYAGSTAYYIDSTSIGKYFKMCKTTGTTSIGTPALAAVRGEFLDPASAASAAASTLGLNFQLIDFADKARKANVRFVPVSTGATHYL